jgi:hypothetical protein
MPVIPGGGVSPRRPSAMAPGGVPNDAFGSGRVRAHASPPGCEGAASRQRTGELADQMKNGDVGLAPSRHVARFT